MLTISDVSKSFGGRTLFADVTLQVNREDCIGLVGPNGAGKSTLFSLILQSDSPDSGAITFQRNTTVGFLPQESAPAGEETVLELATAITPEVVELQKKIKAWESEHPGDTEHQGDVYARFDELGDSFVLESKAKQILAGSEFSERAISMGNEGDERRLGDAARTWRGCWCRSRTCCCWTNRRTIWTSNLQKARFPGIFEGITPGAILMISHDREFLNQLVGSIVEIRQSKIFRYRGNYEDFLTQKAAAEEQQLAAYKNQQKEIAHLQEFADRFRAKASQGPRRRTKLKQIERMEKIEAPTSDEKKINFSFPQPQRSGLKVITLKEIHHAYGANVVYQGIDFLTERDQRVVLVGPNTRITLLKITAGVCRCRRARGFWGTTRRKAIIHNTAWKC